MKLSEFEIGKTFWCGGRPWRCTDIGTRVIIAILLEHDDDPSWYNGARAVWTATGINLASSHFVSLRVTRLGENGTTKFRLENGEHSEELDSLGDVYTRLLTIGERWEVVGGVV